MLSQSAAGLFLDPGLGKTSICLAALKILFSKGLVKRCLVIAPLRPMYKVWPDEIKKWEEFSTMTYAVLHGTQKETALTTNSQIDIINPEGLPWLLSKGKLDYDVLIIDESSKFKDSQTKRFKLLKSWLHTFKRRWILTGTPAPNGLLDLFGQIYVLDLGRSLGRFITHYRNEFFTPEGFGGYLWRQKPDAFDRIVDRIGPLVLQLSAEEYLKMPALDYRTTSVSLPSTLTPRYQELENDFISTMQGESFVGANAAVISGKLRQFANGAIYREDATWAWLHDEKLDALESLLEELNGHPVLVLYEFDHDRQRIVSRCGSALDLKGLTGPRLDRAIDNFNSGSVPVLLGHPASMGHGLNLQGSCHHVIWFGIPWNLEFYDQAIARVYRQGQKSDKVIIYNIVAKDTKDEDVVKVLTMKDRNQQDLLRAIKEHNTRAGV